MHGIICLSNRLLILWCCCIFSLGKIEKRRKRDRLFSAFCIFSTLRLEPQKIKIEQIRLQALYALGSGQALLGVKKLFRLR